MEKRSLFPRSFLVVGLIWLGVGAALSYWSAAIPSLMWFCGLWFLCSVNLLAIGRVIESVIGIVNQRKFYAQVTQLIFWVTIKLACLAFLGFVLWTRGSFAPRSGLLLGLATLIVVPLLGGFIWSRRELKYA